MENTETTETSHPVNGLDTAPKKKRGKKTVTDVPAPVETTEIGQYFLPFLTATSAEPPVDLAFEQWQSAMAALRIAENGLSWWVGDMLDYAQTRGKDFEDHAIQSVSDLGYANKTVLNVLAVCQHMSKERRRADVSFSHHEAVAYMKSAKKADDLLARAANEKWTVSQLRDAVREAEAKKVKTAKNTPQAPEPEALSEEMKARAERVREADLGAPREPDAVATAQEIFAPPTEELDPKDQLLVDAWGFIEAYRAGVDDEDEKTEAQKWQDRYVEIMRKGEVF